MIRTCIVDHDAQPQARKQTDDMRHTLISVNAKAFPMQARGLRRCESSKKGEIEARNVTYPSLKVRSSRSQRKPASFLSIQRLGRKTWASGPQMFGLVCTTLSGIARSVPLGTTRCISEVPGRGSERGIDSVSKA